MSKILPAIFLVVSAFLTNMVLGRLIATERPHIALLKAFGYANTAIAWHYVKLVLAIGAVGTLLGWFFGYWLGLYSTTMYADFYRFPFLLFRPSAGPFLLAAGASVGAALLGAIGAVRRAAALSPAAAMQPPAPPLFRRNRLFLPRFLEQLDQPTRIVLRQTSRWPLRALVTSLGIAMSVAVLIVSMQWLDAIHRIVDVYFFAGAGAGPDRGPGRSAFQRGRGANWRACLACSRSSRCARWLRNCVPVRAWCGAPSRAFRPTSRSIACMTRRARRWTCRQTAW